MKSFDDILQECIRHLEAGGDIEAALSRYPERADELRPYLQVWKSLSAAEKREATPQGALRGRQKLMAALTSGQPLDGGARLMQDLSKSGGFALRLVGAVAVVAAIALGITFLTGNLQVNFGGETEAQTLPVAQCLDDVLGGLDGTPGFTIDDLLAFRDAFQNQDTDPKFDRDGDGDVDVDDLMTYVTELRDCFQQNTLP
jgi:hypothetical protein